MKHRLSVSGPATPNGGGQEKRRLVSAGRKELSKPARSLFSVGLPATTKSPPKIKIFGEE